MNSPFVVEQAREIARRPEIHGKTELSDRVRALYAVLFARAPDEIELEAATQYLKEKPVEKSETMTPTEKLAQVLLLTNEFVHVK